MLYLWNLEPGMGKPPPQRPARSGTRSSMRSARRRSCGSRGSPPGCTPQLVAKVEMLNPGGSIKDRIAVALIEAAERDGQAAARAARSSSRRPATPAPGWRSPRALKGYRVIAVMPDKMSQGEDRPAARLRRRGRRRADRGGARTRPSPTTGSPIGSPRRSRAPSSRTSTSTRRTPRRTTRRPGPEIWRADRRRDHALRRRHRHRRHDHRHRALPQGAEPDDRDRRRRPGGLDLLGRRGRSRTWSRAWARTSGPRRFDPSVVDRYVTVTDRDSFLTTRRLARTRASWPAARAGWRCTRRSRSRARSTTRRR